MNGAKWSVVKSANPSGALTGALRGVSCPSATSCLAVGDGTYVSGNQKPRVFTERWNGAVWKVQASPAGASVSSLHGVGCANATLCFAAGGYEPTGPATTRAFLEQWNGTTWTAVATPVPVGATASVLDDVACVSTTFCV